MDGDVLDALARLDRWRVIAGITGIVALLLALPVRLVTVGGGWDALGDGDFVSDTLTGPIGLATLVTILGVIGLLLVRPSHVQQGDDRTRPVGLVRRARRLRHRGTHPHEGSDVAR